jgi:hypothetical protein
MSRGAGRRTTELIESARDILAEIQPCSVRAVCYRLFAAGRIPNMHRNSTNMVSRLLTDAREKGIIPWTHIVDESRGAEYIPSWTSPTDLIASAIRQYRKNYWCAQPYQVEIWSEKGTIRGTLASVLDEYGLTFRVMHGYASATVINDVAELSTDIHMSDVDLPGRLARYGGTLTVRRVALVDEDLDGLPSFDLETKAKDPRYQWFRRNVGDICYELDAMPPPLLRERVEAEIRHYLDLDQWAHDQMIEAAEVESMETFHKSWQASLCSGERT